MARCWAPTTLFCPAKPCYFSCRLTGYQLAGKPDEQRSVKLSWQMQVTDPKGVPLVADAAARSPSPWRRKTKTGSPSFCRQFKIPPFAPGGAYHIKVTAHDEIAKTELTSQLDFQVRGHSVEPSPIL